jgi:plasmid maintenance system antidote protein VapI
MCENTKKLSQLFDIKDEFFKNLQEMKKLQSSILKIDFEKALN